MAYLEIRLAWFPMGYVGNLALRFDPFNKTILFPIAYVTEQTIINDLLTLFAKVKSAIKVK